MCEQPKSYLSEKCEVRDKGKGHKGVFAREQITHSEVIAIWTGDVMTRMEFMRLPEVARRLTIQIEEELYLSGMGADPADFMNHSCSPNAGLSGQIVVIAMRDIAIGEEICFDYAMSDGTDYDEFECECGAPDCRKYIRGTDWRNPKLWQLYRGYFSPYLQRRIDWLRAQG